MSTAAAAQYPEVLDRVGAALGAPPGQVLSEIGQFEVSVPDLDGITVSDCQLTHFLSGHEDERWVRQCNLVLASALSASELHARVRAASRDLSIVYAGDEETLLGAGSADASLRLTAYDHGDGSTRAFLTSTCWGFGVDEADGWVLNPLADWSVAPSLASMSGREGLAHMSLRQGLSGPGGSVEREISQSWQIGSASNAKADLLQSPPSGWTLGPVDIDLEEGLIETLRHVSTDAVFSLATPPGVAGPPVLYARSA